MTRAFERSMEDQNDDNGEVLARPRSTWAQVVSSGQQEDDDDERSKLRYGYLKSSSLNKMSAQGDGEGENIRDWEIVGNKRKQHAAQRKFTKVPVENWDKYKQPPNEQEYNEDLLTSVDIEPSREELSDLSKACSRLWVLDSNRLVPGKDYEIDCGEGKKVYQKQDMASQSLFSWLNYDIFRRPTYSRFCYLLDNYNPNAGCKEVVTSQEKHEQVAFIEEISRTAPIKYLYAYLVSSDITSETYEEFKRLLLSLWFDLYGRGGGSSCSSSFKHVFVGEIHGRDEYQVSGFHNWIQPDSETQLLTVQFEWNGVLKSLSSTLVGVSPEFEIAIYTLCFFVGGEDNHVLLGPYSVNIKCHRLGDNKIGSVFPIAEC